MGGKNLNGKCKYLGTSFDTDEDVLLTAHNWQK